MPSSILIYESYELHDHPHMRDKLESIIHLMKINSTDRTVIRWHRCVRPCLDCNCVDWYFDERFPLRYNV